MEGEGILRLWSLRPQGHTSVVDTHIRNVIGPAADGAEGLHALFVARRVVDRTEERILASVWASTEAVDAATRPGRLLSLERELGEGAVELMPIILAIAPPDSEGAGPTLLRVFRGDVRPGELDAYVVAARRGTFEDVAAGAGPVGLYLAVAGPDRFVTVSAWQSWERIQIATGGNVQSPIATRHVRHLVSGVVAHYEILPSAEIRPRPVPGLLPELTVAE